MLLNNGNARKHLPEQWECNEAFTRKRPAIDLCRMLTEYIYVDNKHSLCICAAWPGLLLPAYWINEILVDYIDELNLITKTRLFKYIENFTTKNWKFSDKNSDFFNISAQKHRLWAPRCSKHRLWVFVRTVSRCSWCDHTARVLLACSISFVVVVFLSCTALFFWFYLFILFIYYVILFFRFIAVLETNLKWLQSFIHWKTATIVMTSYFFLFSDRQD